MSGRHRAPEPEEQGSEVAFEDIVQGVELAGGATCEYCEERPAVMRVKPCGEEEFSLMCPLCMQVIFLRMSLSIAEAMCNGEISVCVPCQRPVPDVPSLREHVEVQPVHRPPELGEAA